MVLNILVACMAAAAVFEFCNVTGKTDRESKLILPLALIYSFLVPILNEPFILTVLFAFCVFALLIVKYQSVSVTKLFFAAFITVIITVSMACITLLKKYDGIDYLMPLIYASAVTDVFCYLVGILFGRHKLCPVVSPNKSVEGAVGGVVFTAAAFIGYAAFTNSYFNTSFNLILAAAAGMVFAVAAQIGDLAESAIKRKYGVKDFSNLIPGHGGVYDRIDSWITTSPLVLIIAMLL